MLKDIVIVKKDVPKVNPLFQVRGLTLQDIGLLLEDFKEPLGMLMDSKMDMDIIISQYPEFIAKIIAIAAEEPDTFELVEQLPMATQLYALEAVWDLTVPDYEALGKLVARIKAIVPKSQVKQVLDTKQKPK